jgi:hypothetical protein
VIRAATPLRFGSTVPTVSLGPGWVERVRRIEGQYLCSERTMYRILTAHHV